MPNKGPSDTRFSLRNTKMTTIQSIVALRYDTLSELVAIGYVNLAIDVPNVVTSQPSVSSLRVVLVALDHLLCT